MLPTPEEAAVLKAQGVAPETLDANRYDRLPRFLADTQIFSSKGEARKMWQGGGVGINKLKLTSEKLLVNTEDLLQEKYLLVQKGKKNYYLVIAK